MREYADRVAVITGAASGIGYGLAKKCAGNNMHVILADINDAALKKKDDELSRSSRGCTMMPTDVSKADDVQRLANHSFDSYGKVDFLFINAGVNILAFMWEYDIFDWRWIIDVNLWGTIHCLRAFLPRMLRQENVSHIVITSSGGAFLPFQTAGPYNATKYAVLGLAETLSNEVKIEKSKVRVHALCPGMVNTHIDNAEAQRQKEYMNPCIAYGSEERTKYRIPRKAVEAGISPEMVADEVFLSIEKNEFYIFPQPAMKEMITRKYENLLQKNMPLDLSRSLTKGEQ